jgi:fumarate reductase subunit C
MSSTANERSQHYRAPMPRLWWLRRRSHVLFVAREMSSVFVAWSVVFLLLLVGAVARGESAYRGFLDWSAQPWVLALNVVALLFLALHAVTWFNLAPRAMVVKVRGRRLPAAWIAAAHFAAWAVISAVVAWITLA